MKLSTYKPSSIEEIKQLFTKTFSDSEGQSEGLLIGNLAYDLMTSTDSHNLYGFVAIENEQIRSNALRGLIFCKADLKK